MTVGEYFAIERIDRDFIAEFMNDDSPYWINSEKFINQHWNADIEVLTNRQMAWVERILEDCVERRIRGAVPSGSDRN